MKNKINIALFVQSRNLSDEILKKIVKLKNKINIFLVVSDKYFSDKLKQNYKPKYNWIINNKNNEKKILKIINQNKSNKLYAFSIQHKWIVSKLLIDKFKFFVNFHYGDIPKYRGHHPILYSILNREKYIKGTIHSIDEKLDQGFLIDKVKIRNYQISSIEAEKLLSLNFANYFEKLIEKIIKNKNIKLKKINYRGKFHSIESFKKLKEVKSFKELIVKAFAFEHPPHEPAYIKLKNKKIYLSTSYNRRKNEDSSNN